MDYGPMVERQYKNAGKIVKSNDQDLYNKMTTYWPSNKGTDSGFWTHEWNKHGTCVSTLSPKCYGKDYKANKDMIDYFSDAITLRSKYDVYDAFAKAGIKPGDQTNSDQFTISGRNYELTDPPRSGNSGCGGQISWPAKTTKNSTDGNNDNNGNNGSDKTASSIGGVSAVAFVIAVLTLFV
ncbi:ribonuclease T2-like protein [Syncephalis fuscata]|nr:ribonuclease T2-like protein [Syncephalis fuscata]